MSLFNPLGLGGGKPGPTPLDSAGVLGVKAQQKTTTQNKLFDENNTSLDWITGKDGDPTHSPLYNSFLTKSREGISSGYDRAIMNARAGANSRGFGYASPMEQTGELGIRGQEAGALSGAPATALQETMPYNMQALGLRAGEAGTYGEEAMGEENMWNSDITHHYDTQQANKRQLYESLASLASAGMMAGSGGGASRGGGG